MKKPNKLRIHYLYWKREKKRLKRLSKNRIYLQKLKKLSNSNVILSKIDNIVWERYSSKLFDFFLSKDFISLKENSTSTILIPKIFSLNNNYGESIETISKFVTSVKANVGRVITVDFSKCQSVDQPALFLLQILGLEFKDEFNKLDTRLRTLTCKVTYEVIKSPNDNVNKLLVTTGIIKSSKFPVGGLIPIHTLGYLKGSKDQKHYSENKKGKLGTKTVEYINACLQPFDYEFNPQGINYIDGLVSEILNNAEDHSVFGSYYITANLLIDIPTEITNGQFVGELNLTFLNFGDSFYEGLEETKHENSDMYITLNQLYEEVLSENPRMNFSKENLFTLYALQEGISRLKYEDQSRGTGTMKFVSSFLALGDYQDDSKGYIPSLTILSGKTLLICNNMYKNFYKEDVCFISLNTEQDLRILPEESNLKSLRHHFPGTLLTAKIYLNREHLTKKVEDNGAHN